MPPTCARIVGGPGSGKTTRLLEIIDQVIGRLGIDQMQVGFVSFTRAARREAAARAGHKFDIPPQTLEREGWFRTLHSICYRMLGVAKGELISGSKDDTHWLRNAINDSGVSISNSENDDAMAMPSDHSLAGKALALWDAARNRLVPVEAMWEKSHLYDERTPNLWYVKSIINLYEQAKKKDGRIDFGDLLMMFAGRQWTGNHDSPFEECEPHGEDPRLPVWIHDECQDTSFLASLVFGRMIRNSTWVYLAGDHHQCLAAKSIVQTNKGPMTIKEIVDQKVNAKVLSYNEKTGRTEWKRIVGWHKSGLGNRHMNKIGDLHLTNDHQVFCPEEKRYMPSEDVLLGGVKVIYLKDGKLNTVLPSEILDCGRTPGRLIHQLRGRQSASEFLALRLAGRVSGLEVSDNEKYGRYAADCPRRGRFRHRNENVQFQHAIDASFSGILQTVSSDKHQDGPIVDSRSPYGVGSGGMDHGRWIERQSPITDLVMLVQRSGEQLLADGDVNSLRNQVRFGQEERLFSNSRSWGRFRSINGNHQATRASYIGVQVDRNKKTIFYETVHSGSFRHSWNDGHSLPILQQSVQEIQGQKALRVKGMQAKKTDGGSLSIHSQASCRKDIDALRDMPKAVRDSIQSSSRIDGCSNVQFELPSQPNCQDSQEKRDAELCSERSEDREVYCIDVEDNHNFFADGVLVHNCIYEWAGADGRIFQNWDCKKEDFLPVSHRCDRNILEYGKKIIQDDRLKDFHPVNEGGEVVKENWLQALAGVKPGDKTLILTRVNRDAGNAGKILDEACIPWRPTKGNSLWTAPAKAAGVEAIITLRDGGGIDGESVHRLMELFPVKSDGSVFFEHGAKEHYKQKETREKSHAVVPLTMKDLSEAGCTEAFCELIASGKYVNLLEKNTARIASAANKYGIAAVKNPSVRIGTCHSAKGAEEDNVILLNKIPGPTQRAILTQQGLEEERRVWYVSATRARHSLKICEDGGETFSEL